VSAGRQVRHAAEVPDRSPTSSSPDDARCLQVDVDEGEVDLLSGLLWAGGATGVQELVLGPGRVRLVAGLPREAEAGLVARLAPRTVDCFDAEHDGWLDAWRPFARPVRVGRVVVHPPWEPPPWTDLATTADDVIVAVDPGRAFGAGNHVTTRLVVAALQQHLGEGMSVLDVGCGSGVLSVVAARLGAGRVCAVDVEDDAVRATVENAIRNGVAERIDATTGPVGCIDEQFDLVVANILAPVLLALAPDLAARVAPGGRLVLSGLRAAQAAEVVAAYVSAGSTVVDQATDGDWVRLDLTR
jgi:ribosomal protein L11 methyltransferase